MIYSTNENDNDKLSFLAECYDDKPAFVKQFIINFHPCDESIELIDKISNRVYLRNTICENLKINDLFIGNTIRIYGRQLHITDYSDCTTRKFIGKSKERTIIIIKPSATIELGEIITEIEGQQFRIINMRMCKLSSPQALEFCKNEIEAPIVALELVGENAIERFAETKDTRFYASNDCNQVAQIFFPLDKDRKPPVTTYTSINTTCCIIKPHAIKEGKLGAIIAYIIQANFKITALQMLYLNDTKANQFLDIYNGVISDYQALLCSFLDGPCVALEISANDDTTNVHKEFRAFTGPFDSDIAKQIRPGTIRGVFGVDKYKNAVHCTDLPEDTNIELDFFFQT